LERKGEEEKKRKSSWKPLENIKELNVRDALWEGGHACIVSICCEFSW